MLIVDASARPSAADRLLAAATEAMADHEGGLEMADVARRAGVSTGLAYHHFGSKAGLVGAVIEAFYDRYDAVANQLLPQELGWGARERLRTRAVIAFLYAEPVAEIVLARLSAAPEAAAVGAARLDALVRKGARNIASGQASGEIDPTLDPEMAAAFVLGGVRQIVIHALARDPRPAPETLAEDAWAFIARALGVKETRHD